MNDQLQKVLADLAAKFGTSVEHLWDVLICQARIEVITDLFYYALCVLSGIVLYRLHIKFSKEYKSEYNRSTSSYEENDATGFIMAGFAILWLIYLIACVTSMGGTISAALNPQYWALKQILNH